MFQHAARSAISVVLSQSVSKVNSQIAVGAPLGDHRMLPAEHAPRSLVYPEDKAADIVKKSRDHQSVK